MPVLYEPSDPEHYRAVKDRNLEQQYYLLETAARVGVKSQNFRLTPDVLLAFHSTSSIFLEHTPGQFRKDFVHIQNSDHIPPPHDKVPELMQDYFAYLNSKFEESDAFELAAYALWRLTWIHPFDGCNGRTARAYCYYIICMKFGYVPPGPQNMLALMSKEVDRSYELLAKADFHFKNHHEVNVSGLKEYLEDLLLAQLSDTIA